MRSVVSAPKAKSKFFPSLDSEGHGIVDLDESSSADEDLNS